MLTVVVNMFSFLLIICYHVWCIVYKN